MRPQSIKISQLNVREIKDDRTSVPAKCTFLQFRKNLFHLYNLLINNYWHTEFTEYTERRTHYVVLGFRTERRKGAQRGLGVDGAFSFVERLETGVDEYSRFQKRILYRGRWVFLISGKVRDWGKRG